MIHKTADVSSKSEIGENTKIWHQAQVREDIKIGKNCIIAKNVYIDFGVVIGNNVKIQNNASVYHGAIIEDGVFIGPNVCITNDKAPRAINPDGSLKGENDWNVSKVLIKEGASIGAGSIVTKDVHDYGLVYGNPAKLVGVCL